MAAGRQDIPSTRVALLSNAVAERDPATIRFARLTLNGAAMSCHLCAETTNYLGTPRGSRPTEQYDHM